MNSSKSIKSFIVYFAKHLKYRNYIQREKLIALGGSYRRVVVQHAALRHSGC